MSEPNLPLVSVHVLTYNHIKFFVQAIESILAQKTNFPFEIIIGDDCSTDGSSELVDEYAKKYPDLIRVLRPEKNIGGNPNALRVFNACRGKYIALIESDDYWIDPLKLQKQVDFLEKNDDFSICFTNSRIEFFVGDEKPYLLNEGIEKDVFTLDDLIGEKEIWFMATASLMVRKFALLPLPAWFEKSKSGDIGIAMLSARHGKIKYLPDVTAVYRRHPMGISNTDHKDDAVFIENRIMMYSNLNKDTGYQYNDRFKRNLGGWYYLLLNSKQLKNDYSKRLPIAFKYISLMFPRIDNFKIVFRDHILPPAILSLSREIKKAIGIT